MKNRKRCPAHPGRILKNFYLEPLGLTITKLSGILGISRKAVSGIVNEHKSITPDTALRLSSAFANTTAESWLNLQRNYDLWHAAHKSAEWKTIKPVQTTDSEMYNTVHT